jgi:cysteine desulfurase family protein
LITYLDNAATSFPKPKETIDAVNDFLTGIGGNPGRGGSPLSIDAARIVYEAREKLTAFVNGSHSERMIFTQNGTDSLNLAILGLLNENDHVITTALEHNSVMRPLDYLARTRHVSVTVIPCSPSGVLDMEALKKAAGTRTRAVIVNHGSNVIGSVQPLAAIRALIGDTTLIVDACQTIGNVPIDVEKERIDLLCFSCHKALFGIQGLGAIYMREGIDLVPVRFGGTGSRSESTEQPDMLPDKYESGTPNTPAIAGLIGGLSFIEKTGRPNIASKKRAAAKKILEGLRHNGRVQVYGAPENGETLPILLVNVDGIEPSDLGYECNRAGVCVRVGLHCSPVAHRTVGTFPRGAVRVSPGYFTSDADIDRLLEVVNTIAGR